MKFHNNQNNCVVRDLKGAIESLLFKRTGFSTNKELPSKNI